MPRAIPLLTLEARIKRRLRRHLQHLGFRKRSDGMLEPPQDHKESIRAMHRIHRRERLRAESEFIASRLPMLAERFASGREIEPGSISPRLELVASGTTQADLFRLASLTWSVPVSRGYGRRMRFLVWDEHIGKLMGIVALGDPVFNLRARDEMIGWTLKQRQSRLVNMMDAYVLGALPPYNMLLCGKLVACLVRSQEVRRLFSKRYGDARGIISRKKKHATLAMVTTTSALGRSSVYNRLKLRGVKYFESIGYTSGWGHFHVPEDLFADMRTYLELREHPYSANHRYGSGPNWKLRAIRTTLQLVGLKPDLLRHGISREVFVCRLACNAERVLKGEVKRPYCRDLLTTAQVGRLGVERWVIARSISRPEFRDWDRRGILDLLDPSKDGSSSLRQLVDSNRARSKHKRA